MSDGSSTDRVPVGRPSRRRFVAGACAGAVALLAGCSSDGDESGGGANTPGGDDPAGNGATEAGDTQAGGGGTEAGGDGTDSGGDGTASGDDGGATPSAALSDTMTFETSYAMDATITTQDGTREMSGRFHGGNVYWQFDMEGQSAELYMVDGTQYIVTGGQCLVGASQGVPAEGSDPSEFESPTTGTTVQASETTTIDGTEVYVFEVDADAATSADGAVTYYVATATGYPRRIETEGGTWDFHSWGAVDPIEKPDMNCQSMSQGAR